MPFEIVHFRESEKILREKRLVKDIKITKQLIAAGELLGIKVLDHLIVSNQGYKSLRDYHEFPN